MGEPSSAPEPTRAAGLHVALLGHMRLEFDGKPFEFNAQRKTLPILAYLLVHREATVSRDFLAFTMWPDADEDVARGNLRRNLSLLKSILPSPEPAESWILATNELVRWNGEAQLTLDVEEFDRLCREPKALAEAVALYHGDLLEDLYDDWIHSERERLRAAYLTALKTLVYRFRSDRDFSRAIGCAQRILAADPFREDAMRELAATRYLAGDRAGALHVIDEFVKRMRAELGIDAMPETLALKETILREAPIEIAAGGGSESSLCERRSQSRAELPFAGRGVAMERAALVWDQAARGRGTVAFVTGEAGIGKTRFAAELALAAEREGGRVLLGSTAAPESFAYQAFLEALRAAIPLIVTSPLEPVWQSVLATAIPELCEQVRLDPVPALQPDEERTRLFEAIARALRAIATTRPLLLVLEDLHWCGAATADLLRFVANAVASARIAVVVTCRSEEVVRSHPLRDVRRELDERARATLIELPRLDEASVAEIVARAGGVEERLAERARQLYARSLGNPLFLGELMRGDPESVPGTIEGAIAARFSRLSDEARRVLDVAAVVGDTFEFEVVGEVAGWESGVLLDALGELIERHVVRETTRRERGAYAFTHHLIRSTAYGAVPSEDRRRYHRAIARATAAMYATEADQRAADLARHFELAGEPGLAAQRWLQAARHSLASHANEETVAAATRGLSLVDREPRDVDLLSALLGVRADAYDRLGNRDLQRADLEGLVEIARLSSRRELLREALRRSIDFAHATSDDASAASAIEALAGEIEPGDHEWHPVLLNARAQLALDRFGHEEAIRLSTAAAELYRARDDARGEFGALLIGIDARIRCNRYEENVPALQRARELARLRADPAMETRLLQASMLEPILKQDFSAAYRLAGELLDLSRATGNRLGEARAYDRLATAANRMFRIGEALEGYARALEIYESIGDRHGVRGINNNWGSLDVAFGFVDRGRERLERLAAAAAADGDLFFLYYAESNLGVAAHAAGDFSAAKASELRALELARRLGSEAQAALVLGDVGEAEAELGDLDAATTALEEAVAINRRADQRLALLTNTSRLALVYARRGDSERAHALAKELSELHRAQPEAFEDPGELLWRLARTFEACGDATAARDLVERAFQTQAARLAAIDVPEYREGLGELRWYRELLSARDVSATPGR